MIVIADTSPINYLVLINQAQVLPTLYGRVLIPRAVYNELKQERSPAAVKAWLTAPPIWLEIRETRATVSDLPEELDAGETEAILLAQELKADLIIVDDKAARAEAARRHLTVIGTLRVLEDAAELGLLELPTSLSNLQQTTFRADARLIQELLNRDAERKKRRGPKEADPEHSSNQ